MPTSRAATRNALLTLVSHVIFSAEGLRATAGTDHLGRALIEMRQADRRVPRRHRRRQRRALARRRRAAPGAGLQVDVVDTLGAGDTFHGAFTLMLAEGMSERAGDALRGRGRRAQMHALWRHSRRAARAPRSRRFSPTRD